MIALKQLGSASHGLSPEQLTDEIVSQLARQIEKRVAQELKTLAEEKLKEKAKEKLVVDYWKSWVGSNLNWY